MMMQHERDQLAAADRDAETRRETEGGMRAAVVATLAAVAVWVVVALLCWLWLA